MVDFSFVRCLAWPVALLVDRMRAAVGLLHMGGSGRGLSFAAEEEEDQQQQQQQEVAVAMAQRSSQAFTARARIRCTISSGKDTLPQSEGVRVHLRR